MAAFGLYNQKDEDILLHSLMLGHSELFLEKVIKRSHFQKIISRRELCRELACIRKTGRCVNQSGLLFCAGVYYVLLSKEDLSEEINNICKVPGDLFQLINIVLNADLIRNNFKNIDDVKKLISMFKTNPLNPPKKKKSEKETPEEKISSQMEEMKVDKKISQSISKHKFIGQWYLDPNKTALDLLYLLTKFKCRGGWDHQMILRHLHLKFQKDNAETGDINFVIGYIMHGAKSIMKDNSFRDYFCNAESGVHGVSELTSRVYAAVDVLEKSKKLLGECESHIDKLAECITNFVRMRDTMPHGYGGSTNDQEQFEEEEDEDNIMIAMGGEDILYGLPSFYQNTNLVDESVEGPLQRFHICSEHLPTMLNVQPKIWEALLKDLPMSALIRNICHMAQLGVIDTENKENVQSLMEKLKDEKRLQKVHPFQILKAVMEYSSLGRAGSRKKKYKERDWEIDEELQAAMVEAFFLAVGNADDDDLDSDFSYKICIQKSGTMMMPNFTGDPKLSRGKAALAMALGIQHYFTNSTIHICDNLGGGADNVIHSAEGDDTTRFCGTIRRKMKVYKEQKEDGNSKFSSVARVDIKEPSNLALPITKSINESEKIDAFIFFTTSIASELMGDSPYEEFLIYQKRYPKAKMIICAMDVNTQIIADPDNKDVKVLCGADGYLVNEIYQFMHPNRVSNNICKFCNCDHSET